MAKKRSDGEPSIDDPITISFNQFVDYAFNHWVDSLTQGVPCKTLCLLGSPGIGKSSTAYALAERMTNYVQANRGALAGKAMASKAICRLLDFSSMLPEDLNGLPFRDGDETRYCPQRWAHELCEEGAYGVVVQDDLPAAAPAMHTAGRQMALERRIHDHRFAPGVLIIVTGNRREDKAGAHTLPSHFRNSVTMLAIEPDLPTWKKWYTAQPGCDPIITSFLTWKPELFSQTPADEDKLGAFPTPRQWVSLGRQFKTARASGGSVLFAVAAGVVGKPAATTFSGFVEVHSSLPDPARVLADPVGEIPNPEEVMGTADRRIAMVCALGDMAGRMWKAADNPKVREKVAHQLMMALGHVCASCGEFTATGVQTFIDNGGTLQALVAVATTHRRDPVIGPMLSHLKDSVLV